MAASKVKEEYDPFPGGMENATLSCWTPIASPEPVEAQQQQQQESPLPITIPTLNITEVIVHLPEGVDTAGSGIRSGKRHREKLSSDDKSKILQSLELLLLTISELILSHGPAASTLPNELQNLFAQIFM
jgi:hypothetical protein